MDHQSPFKEESLPLITFNSLSNQFEVNDDTVALLKQIKGPLGIIAVAGMYRTGKSYLLNRMLLNRSKGFGVGPSINPCTKGLWVWGTPIAGFAPDGSPMNIIVVDSEGIGGLDEDNNHDMRIFSLALLLSSYFIYNSVGSIDENALSSLSLVVNLTKHIQFKAAQKNENEEEDIQQLADYLPSFMWVVRDFALQLVDEQHSPISSKDYLERALIEKGGSQDPKNDIRKHLKLFFQDRDCSTMIRPLTNEDELQNLGEMDLDELRSEFVDQVYALRKKVINRVKGKTIGNQPMDGFTWASLVQQYVKAINEGAVPNIQSSWNYICREKAGQVMEECKKNFEEEVQEIIQLPMNQQDLEKYLGDIRKQANGKFQKAIKGEQEIVEDYTKELEQFLSAKSEYLQQLNNMECKKYSQEILQQIFAEFEQQLKLQDISLTAEHIEGNLKDLEGFYNSQVYDFPEKNLMLQEAKSVFLQEMVQFVSRKYCSEMGMQKQIEAQIKERLEEQIRENKEEQKAERAKVEERLKQALIQKSELEATNTFLQEQCDNLKIQKDSFEKEYQHAVDKYKQELSSSHESYKAQKEDAEDRLQHMQRHLVQSESEFEKEKALFDQKVEYLEKALKEKQERERDQMYEWQNQKSELSGELRQMCTKYEQDLKALTYQLDEEREKVNELEIVLKDKDAVLQEKISKWDEMEASYKQMQQVSHDSIKQLEQSVSALKKETDKQATIQSKEKDFKLDQLTQQVSDLESQLREATDQVKQRDHEMKKERAIRDQKSQFQDLQLSELKEQLEEAYKQHDSMVKAMKEQNSSPGGRKSIGAGANSPGKVEAMQNEFIRIEEELHEQIKDLAQQLELCQEKNSELELNVKLQAADYEREVKDLKAQIGEVESQRQNLTEKTKMLEGQRVKLMEQADLKLKVAVQQHEDELEEKEAKALSEIKEIQEKSEESLAHLRNFYEVEKEKLEARVNEEKEKANRRLHSFQEDLEMRTREDMMEKEEEIECLQNELRENEQRHQQYVTQMEHELSLKQQMMETLERQAKEQKERVEQLESSRNNTFSKQIEHFDQQRQEYNTKIDKLQLENLEKDRQLAQVQHKLERMVEDVERKKQDMETLKQSIDKDKKQLQDKVENSKKKLQDTQNEAMQQKLDFGRDHALLKQQIEFQSKKIEELQKQTDDSQRFFDEKIRLYKQELQDEASNQIDRITSEKELWENKYEQKRRALKEIEMSLTKTVNEQEKRISQMQAMIERGDEEKNQMEEQYQERIAHLNNQIEEHSSNAGNAYYYGSVHAEDVLKLKGQVQDLEREYADLQATYDRDKALWEGKCQFLESQKETYKRDLIESQKKFEITLEQLQKRGSIDKDKIEINQQALMKVVENKYKNQIKEMMEVHNAQQNESQSKIKRLENEIKMFGERIAMESRGKQSEQGQLEKKLSDLLESEKRLLQENDELKNERDRRIQDYQRQLEKEKETYRAKLSEYEQKTKESENRRATMMFENEKERAKWQLERDNLMSQKSEMYEQIERLQVKKDQLMRENEKMKAEQRGSRKFLLQNTTNMMQATTQQMMHGPSSGSATRQMMGKSINVPMNGNLASTVNTAGIPKPKENKGSLNKYINGSSEYQEKEESGNTTPNAKQHQGRYGY